MVYCTNCGEKLNDNARFCHKCGSPVGQADPIIKESLPVEVELFRRSSDWYGTIQSQVYIDDNPVAYLGNADRIYIGVEPGEHTLTVYMKNKVRLTDSAFFVAESGERLYYVYAFDDMVGNAKCIDTNCRRAQAVTYPAQQTAEVQAPVRKAPADRAPSGPRCPKCHGPMVTQMVSESRKAGCGTILLYVLLALTIFGLLIVIPLALRKKTDTVTYSVCQNCGYKRIISRH